MPSYAAIHGTPSEHGSRPTSQASHGSRRRHPKQVGMAGSASWTSSVINLVNTIVGAGVLAMPHALSNMGITLGTIVILWAGLTAGFGLYLQTRCARYLDRGASSFFALSQITYPNAAVVFDAAIAIKCFGVGVSYLIIIGDLMPGVVRGFGDVGDALYLLDRRFWVTAFMLIVIPLSFLRKLDSLKYTSVIALVSIAYLVVLVVYHYASGDTLPERGDINWVQWQGAIPTLASFPIIVFAYTCHQNMFSILNEIANNTPLRTTAVVGASIGSAASIYILVAITGYLSFGTNIMGNIVAQYTPSVFSTIGRAAIVVLVMFSYPLQVHPCRASVDAVSKWRPQGRSKNNEEFTPASGSPTRSSLLSSGNGGGSQKVPSRPKPEDMSELRFAVITTAIIILSYIVAMTVSSLDKVLAYVGSTGSTSISFILPGLFYYKISSPDSPHHQRLLKDEDDEDYEGSGEDEDAGSPVARGRKPWTSRIRGRQWQRDVLRKLSLALAIYGLVVMVVCLVINTFFIVAH
ncbi:hypothetical protein BAUCODRAFT_220106 [Baudoinia panamericana UAMH 10762]|uniref:Amino acid transporter transmembrane domain-containing protein n=1 Tax=Baudoinia panamericana (strain UAMH 10762) TaxID=717646 RepID=M2LIR9_BAUPA|nr:uncharacterized protein BAUCODRAFT_220106 [Baudoinia panamericana UAMH 10762]EMC94077.1 hypothetical protein BAUCODRAFT_220106 [Baudoinia panamericana UAMH 10762]